MGCRSSATCRYGSGSRCAQSTRWCRGSSRAFYRRYGSSEAEEVAIYAEAADLAFHDRGEDRVVPELLAGMDVRHMELDHRHREDGERVADAIAEMGPCAGVDQDRIHAFGEPLVDALAHRGFTVGLEAHHLDAQLAAEGLKLRVDLGQRDRAVLRRVALAEHVVVDAVEHEDLHVFTCAAWRARPAARRPPRGRRSRSASRSPASSPRGAWRARPPAAP